MRAVVLRAALPAWLSAVVLSALFHAIGSPAYVTMGVCLFIGVMTQSVLQARLMNGPRPLRHWILSGALAVVGASTSAWIQLR